MSKPLRKPETTKTLDAPGPAFRPCDRVRFKGAGREWIGTVVERKRHDGRSSIHPPFDDSSVYVRFDDTGVSSPVSLQQLEHLPSRRTHRM